VDIVLWSEDPAQFVIGAACAGRGVLDPRR